MPADDQMNLRVTVDASGLTAGMDAAASKVETNATVMARAMQAAGYTAAQATAQFRSIGVVGPESAATIAAVFGSQATPAIKATDTAVRGLNLNFAATQLAARELGVAIPFGAARAISSIGGIGTALSAAFPLLLGGLLAGKVYDLVVGWGKLNDEITGSGPELDALDERLAKMRLDAPAIGPQQADIDRLDQLIGKFRVYEVHLQEAGAEMRHALSGATGSSVTGADIKLFGDPSTLRQYDDLLKERNALSAEFHDIMGRDIDPSKLSRENAQAVEEELAAKARLKRLDEEDASINTQLARAKLAVSEAGLTGAARYRAEIAATQDEETADIAKWLRDKNVQLDAQQQSSRSSMEAVARNIGLGDELAKKEEIWADKRIVLSRQVSEAEAKAAQSALEKQIRQLDELNAKNLEGRNFDIEQAEAAAKQQQAADAETAKVAKEQDDFIAKADLDLKKIQDKTAEETERQAEQSYQKQTEAFLKYAKQREKAAEEEAKKQQEATQRALLFIDSAFNSNLSRWITGQERWRRAWYEMMNGMTQHAIEFILKVLEKHLAAMIQHDVIDKIGMAHKLATQATGNAEATAQAKTASEVKVATEAGTAGAAQLANVIASVPFPENVSLAPAMAAAAVSQAEAYGQFDRGGIVPKDMPAIVHEGEGVFTPRETRNIRNIAEGGGSGNNYHVHMGSVSAFDSRGIDRVLERRSTEVQRAITRMARRSNMVNRGWIRR